MMTGIGVHHRSESVFTFDRKGRSRWTGIRSEFQAARRTIQGYEAMHMIRKGQARWVSGSDVRRQIQFINNLFEVAA